MEHMRKHLMQLGIFAAALACGSGRAETLGGFESFKVYELKYDCVFDHESANELDACPAPTLGSGRNALTGELVGAVVQAGMATFTALLKTLGTDKSYSLIQGVAIENGPAPRCLLLVEGRFIDSYSEHGRSLGDYLSGGKGSKGGVAPFRPLRCLGSDKKPKDLACVMATPSGPCDSPIGVGGITIGQKKLLQGIRLAKSPNFVAEFAVHANNDKSAVRLQPTYLDYSASLDRGRGAKRDLVLLAATSKVGEGPTFDADGSGDKKTPAAQYAVFNWPESSTGAWARFPPEEPLSPWIRYVSEAPSNDYNLWFALVETRKGNLFLANLATALEGRQAAITTDLTEGLVGVDAATYATNVETALTLASALTEKRNKLLSSSAAACAAKTFNPAELRAIEPDFYAYASAYTKTKLAMDKAGRAMVGFPKPPDGLTKEWMPELCLLQ